MRHFPGVCPLAVCAALLALSGGAQAQVYNYPYVGYEYSPAIYDQSFYNPAPPVMAGGYNGGPYRRSAYSAADLYVTEEVAPTVAYQPIVQRDYVPVIGFEAVDTVVGYAPVVEYQPVRRRYSRKCGCNRFY